jgi:hypothetical protein
VYSHASRTIRPEEREKMGAASRLVLYGNSMFLAGIKAELEQLALLELITVEAGCPDAAALVGSFNPRVVLFDLASEHPGLAVSLLREQPDLLLIGVDPCSDELLVLSSRPARALSISDLAAVIREGVSALDHPKG